MEKLQKDCEEFILYSPDSLKYITDPMEDILKEAKKIVKKFGEETINVLENLEPNYYYFISEIFDDLSLHFKSMELIECMKRNAARTNVDCDVDIEYAIQALKY